MIRGRSRRVPRELSVGAPIARLGRPSGLIVSGVDHRRVPARGPHERAQLRVGRHAEVDLDVRRAAERVEPLHGRPAAPRPAAAAITTAPTTPINSAIATVATQRRRRSCRATIQIPPTPAAPALRQVVSPSPLHTGGSAPTRWASPKLKGVVAPTRAVTRRGRSSRRRRWREVRGSTLGRSGASGLARRHASSRRPAWSAPVIRRRPGSSAPKKR